MDLLARSFDLFVHVAFWTGIHSLWQGTALALSLALWRYFAREQNPGVRSAAATLTLIFLAAAPLATAATLALHYRPPTPEPAPTPTEGEIDALAAAFLESDFPLTEAEAEPVVPFSLDDLAEQLPRAIVFLWTLGVLWGGANLARSALRLHAIGRESTFADDSLATRCRSLAARCGLSRAPRLLCSASARGPYAYGLLRPCIVLPAAWVLETSPELLEAAIAHELAHLKRRDLWILALQRLVETALFFHPAVWYVSRTLEAERERDADRLAARILGDPAQYAESLCHLASLVDPPNASALTVPFHGESRMKLLERVQHVLRTEETRSGGIASVGWLCLAPALLAAILFGQAVFVGSLRADEEPQATPVEADPPEAVAGNDGQTELVDPNAVAIDELVRQNLTDSDEADDAVFLRRLYLDLAGQLPTKEYTAQFVGDDSPDKREQGFLNLALQFAGRQDDRVPENGRGQAEDEDEEGDDEEDEDEDEKGDEKDDAEGDDDDAEARLSQMRRQFMAEKEALDQALRAQAEKIRAQYQERLKELEAEMAKAQALLQAEAQKAVSELERQMAEAAKREGERQRSVDERRNGAVQPEGDDDLTPRERRLMGVIRALEARLREVEGRAPGAANRRDAREDEDDDDEGPGTRQRREGDRREEGDRPKSDKRDEGDGEEGNLKESEEQEAQEREAAKRDAGRPPQSEEEAVGQQRDNFAERLYNALRGEGILDDRKPEFVRRAILDVLEFELTEEQVKLVLERAGGEFEGFRRLISRIDSAERQ